MELILIMIAILVIIAIGFALYYRGIITPELFFNLFNLLECCWTICVFGITFIVTIGGFLLWHSLFVAAMAGGSVMMIMFIVLSVHTALYKTKSQLSWSSSDHH